MRTSINSIRKRSWFFLTALALIVSFVSVPNAIAQSYDVEYEYDEYQWYNPADWFGNYGDWEIDYDYEYWEDDVDYYYDEGPYGQYGEQYDYGWHWDPVKDDWEYGGHYDNGYEPFNTVGYYDYGWHYDSLNNEWEYGGHYDYDAYDYYTDDWYEEDDDFNDWYVD